MPPVFSNSRLLTHTSCHVTLELLPKRWGAFLHRMWLALSNRVTAYYSKARSWETLSVFSSVFALLPSPWEQARAALLKGERQMEQGRVALLFPAEDQPQPAKYSHMSERRQDKTIIADPWLIQDPWAINIHCSIEICHWDFVFLRQHCCGSR